eukprot:CAMPEP_0197846302 /NCGR_PEP_ID=MMETSP1438-20131217/3065_1 /TAXON_ID=1461541 /ORGANISM="Pterosperma sp., Strain CCMP1384" /LENGTH=121 /DNA_ID=CAMNT_0043457893 /DNA_START=72 /DNA_END=437 /DNA_ORIENTATION=-
MRVRYLLCLLVLVAFLLAGNQVEAGPKKRNQRSSHLDKDIKQRRTECEALVQHLGEQCTETSIGRENCILRCISEACYDESYGTDPLEEGEVDTVRGRAFRACARNALRQKREEERKVGTE